MMKCLSTVHFSPENIFVVRTEVDRMTVSMHMHNYYLSSSGLAFLDVSFSELQTGVPLS